MDRYFAQLKREKTTAEGDAWLRMYVFPVMRMQILRIEAFGGVACWIWGWWARRQPT
jgi:hypothetical protein